MTSKPVQPSTTDATCPFCKQDLKPKFIVEKGDLRVPLPMFGKAKDSLWAEGYTTLQFYLGSPCKHVVIMEAPKIQLAFVSDPGAELMKKGGVSYDNAVGMLLFLRHFFSRR